MAGTFIATGSYSNLTRLELEQLRRGDYAAGGKALTIGDSGLAEGIIGPGNVNSEQFYSSPFTTFDEFVSILAPDSPGKMLGKTFEVYGGNGEVGSWLGPTELTRAFSSSGVVNASNELLDAGADFVADGVQAGDLILFYLDGGAGLTFGTASVGSVDSSTQITCTNILLADNSTSFGGLWPAYEYSIVRPNAVQLFAVPGSGPLGQEQTFLFVDPASTLHANTGPTTDQINADRITNIIPPKYNKDATVDRADAVYRSPAPGGHLGQLGYRVVLYPDDGTGTGPDMSSPITALNPVIDAGLPAGDQRMTIDYAAGVVRFSCAPTIGGDIKVTGGVNATTGRLNLYAVAFCYNRTADNEASAQRLFMPTATESALGYHAGIKWTSPTWEIRGLKSDGGQSLIKVAGNTAADQQLRIMEDEAPNTASIVGKLNAQVLTVGNGTTTFGDYNGPNAIIDAVTAAQNSGPGSLTIRVKPGAYATTTSADVEVDITIVGDSADNVVLTANGAATTLFSVSGGARFTLKNITLKRGTAASCRMNLGGSFRAHGCIFKEVQLYVPQPDPYVSSNFTAGTPGEDLLLVEDCVLDYAGLSNSQPIRLLVEEAGSMRGLRFKNCVIRGSNTGDALVYVQNDLPVGEFYTISDITFENCQLQPHACASTSATVIAKPSGVFYADPASTNEQLTVTDVNFINCNVTVATNGTAVGNTILLHVSPIAYNAANLSNKVIHGTYRIRGGTWQTPSGRGSNVVPFFLQCLNPVVEDVTFVGGGTAAAGYDTAPGYIGHGYYTAAMRIALRDTTAINPGVTEAPMGWATFAASGEAIEAITAALRSARTTGMTVKNITFNNLTRLSGGAGAAVFVGPNIASGPAQVDGVYINNPAQNTVNSNFLMAGCWLAVFTGGSGATNRGTNGYFRNLVFRSATNSLTSGARWANFCMMEFCPEGNLHVEDVLIDGGAPNGDTSAFEDVRGIRIAWTWNLNNSATLPAVRQGPFTLKKAQVRWTRWGVWGITDKTCTEPYGPWTFEHVSVEHNTTQPATANNPEQGFYFDYAGQIPGGVVFRECEVRGKFRSTGDAFFHIGSWLLVAVNWSRAAANGFYNCRTYIDVFNNYFSAGSAVVYVECGGGNPSFTFTGNSFLSRVGGFADSPHNCRLTRGSGQALVSPSLGGGAFYRGAHIGHNTASGQQYLFVSGQPMVWNDAILLTP